jgi:hypothetical protein
MELLVLVVRTPFISSAVYTYFELNSKNMLHGHHHNPYVKLFQEKTTFRVG